MRILLALIATCLTIGLATACAVPTEPTPVQPAEQGNAGGENADGKSAEKTPIKLAATRAKAKASVLSTGDPLSCVKVTVTNQTKKNLEINPLYFSLTDSDGTKHDTTEALGEYDGQIATTTLAPGENAKGLVCARGKFTPKQVTMTNEIFDEAARAEVAA